MRNTLMALVLATALPTVAFAAPNGEHMNGMRGHGQQCAMMHGVNHAKMAKELALTKEQRQKMHAAQRTQMEKHHEITQRYLSKLPAAEKAAMEKELQAAKDQQNKALRETLSSEQQKRYDVLLKEHEQKQAERAEFEAWKAARDAKKVN